MCKLLIIIKITKPLLTPRLKSRGLFEALGCPKCLTPPLKVEFAAMHFGIIKAFICKKMPNDPLKNYSKT